MKINFDTKRKHFYFSLSDFKDFFCTMDSDSQESLIDYLGWNERALTNAVRVLSEGFSRENYNAFIHKYREKILENIKQEEIKYYADKISTRIEELYRKKQDYWGLYNYVKEKVGICGDFNLPKQEPINFDLKKQLAEIVEEIFSKKFLKKKEK